MTVALAEPRRTLAWLPDWLRNRWGAAGLVAAAYVLAYVAWTFFRWGGEENRALISDLAFLPVSLFAAVAAWRVAADRRLEAPLRQAWLIIGLSVFTQFVADLIWFDLEILRGDPPFPSLADAFYLAFYPLALWGLLRLPGARVSQGDRWKFWLDLSIVMTAAWMVVWFFIISPAAAATDSDFLSQFLTAAYPIGDLVVLGGVLVLLFRRNDAATRSALLLFMAGLILYVGADLIYGYQGLYDLYASGGWLDVGWIAAYLCFALAALRQPYLSRGSASEQWAAKTQEWSRYALPFAAIGLGYGLVIYVAGTLSASDSQVQGLFAGAAALTVAVVARQMVALRENMRLNAELREFSAQLEQRVADRTLQLQQLQDEVLASQKLGIVGTLASEVVHEVSNPLNTIVTACEMLEGELAEEQAVDRETLELYLPIISRAAWHAARIMQGLRNLSRGSAPELAPQDTAAVIQEALLLMGGRLKHWQHVRLVTEVEPDLPPVVCDRNQITQVLVNLLNNARDAMPDGGAVTLRARRTPEGVLIEVADEGLGIAPENLQRIFDPFFTTKPVGKGSGIGLSLVTRIVRAHRGTIAARSAGPGRGATFAITLPEAPPE